jgi:cytoskeletal protein CcmA (bactofilin family)
VFGNNTNKKPQASPVQSNTKAETVIGSNTSLVGALKADGNARIDGAVEGEIEVLGNLIIGTTGRVIATIKAQISPTGKVWGDITAAGLHIEPGGMFRGQSSMMTNVDEPLLLEAPSRPVPGDNKA